jgi:REP element-mobilizing transposase RayT
MPDHLHLLIWWDIESNSELTVSSIMHRVKGRSSNEISGFFFKNLSEFQRIAGRQGFNALPPNIEAILRGIKAPSTRDVIKIWQSGSYDFNVFSPQKLMEKLRYVHHNPFKDNRITDPEHYRYSSRLFSETGKGVLAIDSLP